MRGGRILLIGGILLVVLALAVGGFLMLQGGGLPGMGGGPQTTVEEGTPGPTPLPPDLVRIVVSAQNIPRGMLITSEMNAVIESNWPKDAVPPGSLTDPEAVYGRIARLDIPLGMPILESMLTTSASELAEKGSDISLQIPKGMGGYALPVGRYSSVAWGLRPGDHVDIIISVLMVELDEEWQSALPNYVACVSPTEEEGCQGGKEGRLQVLPNGWLVNLTPSEARRPQLITQLTVQNVLVLGVGDWPEPTTAAPAEGEAAAVEPTPAPTGAEGEQAAATTRPEIQPVTLAVTPQEALVLDYLQSVGARINLVLRSAADAQAGGRFSTEPVTLEYIMNAYRIQYPTKLPYGVTPPIFQLERIPRNESAAQYSQPQ